MILISLLCAALAAWAFNPRAGPVAVDSRLAGPEPAVSRISRRPLRHTGFVLVLGVVSVTTGGALEGGRGASLALAAGIAVATAGRLATSHARTRAALSARRRVTEACATLAAQVRIGRLPADALILAAEDCPILRPASSAQLLGGDVAAVWRAQARRRGHHGLVDLARAWLISTRTGAPMAAALERVADAMAAEDSVGAVVASELAGPRATGKIMAFLPLAGVALGYALGGDPIGFLLDGWVGWSCLVGGVGLAAAGVMWVESLAQRAAVRI